MGCLYMSAHIALGFFKRRPYWEGPLSHRVCITHVIAGNAWRLLVIKGLWDRMDRKKQHVPVRLRSGQALGCATPDFLSR
jgi:hypothetical protein